MELLQLRYFLVAAQYQHITKARRTSAYRAAGSFPVNPPAGGRAWGSAFHTSEPEH